MRPISLNQSREWSWIAGAIRHRTGRYFSVVGIENPLTGLRVPLLEQREIGTLAFIRRERNAGVELLVQAKLEPGDLGWSQLAPSVQATASNLARVHGGAAQPFAEFVTPNSPSHLDSRQSEQGTRFLGKLNRNVLVTADIPAHELPANLIWTPARELLGALHIDHAVNTDARSVLVSSPWDLLVPGPPFGNGEDPWRQALAASVGVVREDARAAAKAQICALRADGEVPVVRLEELDDWSLDLDGQVTVKGREYVVRQIEVETNAREVAHWDQPIIDTSEPTLVDLEVCVVDGVVEVDLAATIEAGLVHRAEWGPTRIGPITGAGMALPDGARLLVEVRQSDEGGRFYQDVAHYRLIQVLPDEPRPGHCRLTLGELQSLLAEGGWLTNEMRSALSLVLTWL